jgi:hypothetical protein
MITGVQLQSNLRRVVLIGSSSRGGSSITTEYLRQSDDLLHIPAEFNPLLEQCGLTYPKCESDRLTAEQCTESIEERLWEELAKEVGSYVRGPLSPLDWQCFSHMIYKRLQWQWSWLKIDFALFTKAFVETRLEVQNALSWGDTVQNPDIFHLLLLRRLRTLYPEIDPRWYDIDSAAIARYFPKLAPLESLPVIFEEPPFVLVAPWRKPTLQDLSQKPLVIKTPSNAYRLPFFRRFFAAQQMDVLHLKREPASSINGLIDGWRYARGFHAHLIDEAKIEDSVVPAGVWKYDLPPGFDRFFNSQLIEVCAFQWSSAHHLLLEEQYLADDTHSVWFEEVVLNNPDVLHSMWRWLDVNSVESVKPILKLPPVMSTCKPRSRRWFEKKDILDTVLNTPQILNITERLHEES